MKPIRDRGNSYAAEIPAALLDADHTLTRYGRWATTSRGGSSSILGRLYIREADARESLEAYQRRRSAVPSDPVMTAADAMLAQRALAAVSDRERVVLTVLYVPSRLPIYAQFRLLRIPPQLAQIRHLAGLRQFQNWHGVLQASTQRRNLPTIAPT